MMIQTVRDENIIVLNENLEDDLYESQLRNGKLTTQSNLQHEQLTL